MLEILEQSEKFGGIARWHLATFVLSSSNYNIKCHMKQPETKSYLSMGEDLKLHTMLVNDKFFIVGNYITV